MYRHGNTAREQISDTSIRRLSNSPARSFLLEIISFAGVVAFQTKHLVSRAKHQDRIRCSVQIHEPRHFYPEL